MDAVADVRAEEAVQRVRRAAGDERRDPVRDRRQERDDAPQRQPDEVRQREQEPEEDGEAAAAPVVVDGQPHRVGRLGPRPRQRGGAVGVAVGEEGEVAVGLGGVAEAVDGEIPQARVRAPAGEDHEPGADRDEGEDAGERRAVRPRPVAVARRRAGPAAPAAAADERRGEHAGRQPEDDPEGDRPPVLARGRGQLEVDGVAGLAEEARVRVGGEAHVRVQVDAVADVRPVEAVQAGRPAGDERPRPQDGRDDDDRDPPQPPPDDVRDREDQAEDDRQAAALQRPVAHDDLDRMRRRCGLHGPYPARFAGRARPAPAAARQLADVNLRRQQVPSRP